MDGAIMVNNHQIAVLIDCENTGLHAMQWLFDQLSEMGRIILKRAYADWSTEGQRRDQVRDLGIEPIQIFHSESGKNSSDIRLAIDAVDLMYQSPVDTFVIVSSDTDFASLVGRLRASGKTVIGAGRKAAVSKTLVMSCDKYYYLDQAVASVATGTESLKPASVLRRAVEASMDEEGRVLGSKLHQTMTRLDPSFDYKAEGFSSFTKFLEASSEVRVTHPESEADVAVQLAEAGATRKPPARRRKRSTGPTGTIASDVAGRSTALSAEQERAIDERWTERLAEYGSALPGPVAADEAATLIGLSKLSASPYKTLRGLLEASASLKDKWQRKKNQIVPRPSQ